MKEDNDLKKYLGTVVDVVMDRKLGTTHPKHGFLYELNYGYVPNTINSDGEEIDVYVLGVNEPIDTFNGKVIAIIHRLNDNDDKLIVTSGENYTDEEIKKLTNFQEKFFTSEIIRNK
jgi:inorganic pyrophosphatase